MKRLPVMGILLVLFVTCNKPYVAPEPVDPGSPLSFYIFEKVSNKPVSNAMVSLRKCSRYDIEFGCQEYSTYKTAYSDATGLVKFSNVKGLEGIEIRHDKYFFYVSQNAGDVYLTPIATIKATISRGPNYLPTDLLYVLVSDPDNFSIYWSTNAKLIGTVKDTVVYFEAYGNSQNQVYWYLNYLSTDTLHPGPSVYLNGFDTASIDLKY